MNILFVTATRIGDAVLSTGLLGHLVERHPGARLTIAAGPVAAPLFEAVPGLVQPHRHEKRRARRALARALPRGRRHSAGTSSSICAARRWPICCWTRARRVAAKGDMREHRVQQLARLFALDPPPAPRLWLAPQHRERAAALVPPGGPVLAIGPAANWRGKEWPAERFAALAQRLTAPGGLAAARARRRPRRRRTSGRRRSRCSPRCRAARRIDLVGKADLLDRGRGAAPRCALRRQRYRPHACRRGGRHADARPVRPEPASQYAPWGPHAAIASTAIPAEEIFRRGFDHRTTDTLMDSLSVEAAEAAARRLWQRVAGEAA